MQAESRVGAGRRSRVGEGLGCRAGPRVRRGDGGRSPGLPTVAAAALAGLALAACGGAGGAAAGGGAANVGGSSGTAPKAANPNPQRPGAPTITIHFCTPKAAANAADPCWKDATATPLTNVMAGTMATGFSGTFQAVWNTKNLFILEQIKNPEGFNPSNANTTDPWESDAMEVYLSSDNGTDTGMSSNDTQIDIPLGAPSSVWVYTNQSDNGVQGYVKNVSGGYDVMLTIPWADTGGSGTTPGIGQVIGLDPAADTYSNGTSQNQSIAWGSPGSSEQNPSIWGQAVLAQ